MSGTHDGSATWIVSIPFAGLLAQLPPRERELIALKYGGEMTNRAIVAVTGLSESNVGTILHRTIGKLRAAWEEQA